MSFSRTLGSLLGIGGGTRGIASPDDEAQAQPVKQGPYLPAEMPTDGPWAGGVRHFGGSPTFDERAAGRGFQGPAVTGPGAPSVPSGDGGYQQQTTNPDGSWSRSWSSGLIWPGLPPQATGFQVNAQPPQQSASAYQAPQPTTRISTARPPQTLGGLLGIGGYGYGPSRPSSLPSQLPMGRASATGSIPFRQDGRNTWSAWGGMVR